MILWFCFVCVLRVWLFLSPELSKEMVILMKYQQPTHSKNGQVLKIKKKKKHNYQKKKKKNLSLLPPSAFCFLKLVFFFKFLIFFFFFKS